MSKVPTLLIIICMSFTACKSPNSSSTSALKVFHGPSTRLVTVERWASVAGFAVAWAVYPDKVVIFTRNDFGKPEDLIAEQSIDATKFAKIEGEIENLPAGLIGKHFSKRGVHDGVFYRISFSPTGALTADRIEVENMYLAGVASLLEAIDAQLPADRQIHYEKMMRSKFNELNSEVESVYVP
jgi:hypothetical protein